MSEKRFEHVYETEHLVTAVLPPDQDEEVVVILRRAKTGLQQNQHGRRFCRLVSLYIVVAFPFDNQVVLISVPQVDYSHKAKSKVAGELSIAHFETSTG